MMTPEQRKEAWATFAAAAVSGAMADRSRYVKDSVKHATDAADLLLYELERRWDLLDTSQSPRVPPDEMPF